MLLYNIFSNIFPSTRGKDTVRQFFNFLSHFLCAGSALGFFHCVGNLTFSKHDIKINYRLILLVY